MSFSITCNIIGSRTFELLLENGGDTLVSQLKAMVEAENPDTPISAMMVVFAGKKLEDAKSLADCGIGPNAKVFIGITQGSSEKDTKAPTSPATAAERAAPSSDAFVLNFFIVGKGKKTLEVPNGAETTAAELSTLIEAHFPDQPAVAQVLAVNGKKIESGTLASCNVKSGQTVYVGRKPGVSGPTGAVEEDLRSADAIITELMTALGKIKAAAPFDDFVGAMKKVSILLGNLIDHPDDPKYKRVRTGNAALQRALFKFDGGMDAIRALGYRESEEEPGTLFVKHPSQHLAKVRKMLVDAFKQQGIPLEASTPSSSSANHPSSQQQQQRQQPQASPFAFMNPFGMPSQQQQQQQQQQQAPSTANPFAAMQGMMGGAQDPFMQSMLSNPQLMEAMMPQVQEMMRDPQRMQEMMQTMQHNPMFANNPVMQAMMADPGAAERMSQMASQMAANPQMMQQMMQSMQAMQGSQGSANQPLFPPNLFSGFQQPQQQPQQQQQPPPQNGNTQFPSNFGSLPSMSEEAMIEEAIRRSLADQSSESGTADNGNARSNNGSNEASDKDRNED